MFDKNTSNVLYPMDFLFTDEKHHRDADEAFRTVSERAARLSKGKSIALSVISHV